MIDTFSCLLQVPSDALNNGDGAGVSLMSLRFGFCEKFSQFSREKIRQTRAEQFYKNNSWMIRLTKTAKTEIISLVRENLRELWDFLFHKIPSQPQPQLQQNWGHPNTCIARSGPIDEAGFVGQQNFGRWGRSLRRPGQPSKDLSTFQSSDDLECKRFASFLTRHFSSRK